MVRGSLPLVLLLGLLDLARPRSAGAQPLAYDIWAGPDGPVVRAAGRPFDGRGARAGPTGDDITRWVEASACAVSLYYGRFPVSTRLLVATGGPGRIDGGQTRGGARPTIRIVVGRATTLRDLETDWVLTHEMVHLAFPDLDGAGQWLEEGIATYVEPIARVGAGTATPDDVWRWLLWGLPKGLPASDDGGLDEAESWGRTYWGGALFCFLADVEIRRATAGRLSLNDALRGILDSGGDIRAGWTLARSLAAGDEAIGLSVLVPLYERMGRAAGTADLHRLFRELGVGLRRGSVTYDDRARDAAIRRAITGDPPGAGQPARRASR